jgi:hypothetical protein
MKYVFQTMLQPKVFIWVLTLLSVSKLGESRSSCQVSGASNQVQKTAVSAEPKGTAHSASQSASLSCPPTRPSSQQESQTRSNHHKVTLSWIAAPISKHLGGDVAGYCLYRSKTQYAAKKDPLCEMCERVNLVPLQVLSCIDNSPSDATIYYYVVTAINGAQNLSLPSNEATAPIPPGDQPGQTPASSSPPPPCQGDSGTR